MAHHRRLSLYRTGALVAGLFAALVTSGCVDSARIKSDDEAILIDQKRGGIQVYDQIVTQTLKEMLDEHRDRNFEPESGRFLVCFLGIENKGAEELGDHEAAIYDTVEEIFVNAQYYDVVSKRFVDTARRASGLRDAEQIYLQEPQERFLSVLKKEGLSPDYFLWGKMTTQTSKHRGLISKQKERRYRFSMEMIDVHSGLVVSKKSHDNIKAYRDW